jgi:hypothetical protein
LSPKSSEIVGVIGKVNKEQVEEESFCPIYPVRSWKY